MTVSLWQAEQQRAQAAGEPEAPAAGWPRPRPRDAATGWPIPWIISVAADRAWFRLLHGHRLVACQTRRLCQVCGQALGPRAWVVADRHGTVVTSAAMHRRCLRLAAGSCLPLAASTGHRHVEATRKVILADGVPLPAAPRPVVQQTWTIVRGGCQARRGTGSAAGRPSRGRA